MTLDEMCSVEAACGSLRERTSWLRPSLLAPRAPGPGPGPGPGPPVQPRTGSSSDDEHEDDAEDRLLGTEEEEEAGEGGGVGNTWDGTQAPQPQARDPSQPLAW